MAAWKALVLQTASQVCRAGKGGRMRWILREVELAGSNKAAQVEAPVEGVEDSRR